MKDTKYRVSATLSAMLLMTICTALTFIIPIETTSVKIIGSYASILVITVVTWKFPLKFYYFAMAFDFFAAALGSVINLYKTVGFYDRFVHCMSGILLAEAGTIIYGYIVKKRLITHDRSVQLMFAVMFSCACAAFWEIYEFTADTLLKTEMQGDNTNTMGDIVSGVLGSFIYLVTRVLITKISKRKKKNK